MPQAKKGKHPSGPADCVGADCDWVNSNGRQSCVDGSGGCQPPHFCEAEESGFHDKNLQEATKKINRILSRIPADPKGRKLSFCETHMGTLLAWVGHGAKPGKGRQVTRRDDDATVAKALKLKVGASKKR
jgi:hypothetical protein